MVRNLSDMDEDLVTDSDAEFESTKIIQPRAAAPVSSTPEPSKIADDVSSDGQHFFPSFASLFPNHPLGHSRPPIYDDPPSNHRPRHIPYALQQANSFQSGSDYYGGANANSFNTPQQTPSTSTTSKGVAAAATDSNVLGSGNFGVIRGGTFYEDDYDNDDYFYPYNNGHAPKSAYSEFHIIYVNKNGTQVDDPNIPNTKPRNIFEQLTRLDESESKEQLKKGVNGKKKLALYKEKENEKYYKKKQAISSPKEFYHEPLLALS
ncbi:hypothetical protein B566_EDAN009678 [Ephemera danica]|nr:hypothetical protein B566_EDAN009678 [Ephemera danica]